MALVLVVDDEPGICMVLDLSLTAEGHKVETLKDGLLALDRLALSPRPDILITDLNLPGLNGISLIEFVHANPDLSSIPVILISGSIIDPSHFTHGEVMLVKPFDLKELNRQVGMLTH